MEDINILSKDVVYFALVTEGLEFVAEREILEKIEKADILPVHGLRLPQEGTQKLSKLPNSQFIELQEIDDLDIPSKTIQKNIYEDDKVNGVKCTSEYRSGIVFFKLPYDVVFDPIELKTIDNVFSLIKKDIEREKKESGERRSLLLDGNEEDLIRIEEFVSSTCSPQEWERAADTWSRIRRGYPLTPHCKSINEDKRVSNGESRVELKEGENREKENSFLSPRPSFRASCSRYGSQEWRSPLAAGAVGSGMVDRFGWKVSLTKFELEAFLLVVHSSVVFGLSLTARPTETHSAGCSSKSGRAKRRRVQQGHVSELGKTSLSPTIANALLYIADPQPGHTVLDPFCGIGTIPIHAAVLYKVLSFGSDISEKDLTKAQINVNMSLDQYKGVVQLVRGDARYTPLPNGSVNVVVTDLPFGIRSGSKKKNRTLYKETLDEAKRVLADSGVMVLMTADRDPMERALSNTISFTKVLHTVFRMGTLEIGLYVYRKK